MKLNEVLNRTEYINLIENLPYNPMLMTFGGSYAYGTNNENSDIDIRGILHMSESMLLGNETYEQFEDKKTDTVLYSFNKIFSLLTSCNPNTIEILGCNEYYADECGKMLLDNYKLFLSKKALYTFRGYAEAQLHRLKNALANDAYDYSERQEHITNVINNVIDTFNSRYKHWNGNAHCYMDSENQICLKMNADMKISELNHILNELHNVSSSFNKLNNRNHKKDEQHLCKHAMHLMRLYYMLIDILKGEIKTYRSEEHNILMDIRNGKYMVNGRFSDEFFENLEEIKKSASEAVKYTSLPDNPDMKKLNELKIAINKMSLEKNEKHLKYIQIS